MTRQRIYSWGIGTGLVAGLLAGGAVYLAGYEFLAVGVALVAVGVVSLGVGAGLAHRSGGEPGTHA